MAFRPIYEECGSFTQISNEKLIYIINIVFFLDEKNLLTTVWFFFMVEGKLGNIYKSSRTVYLRRPNTINRYKSL